MAIATNTRRMTPLSAAGSVLIGGLAVAIACTSIPAAGDDLARVDCPAGISCPQLVVIDGAPGGFDMGSAPDEEGRLDSESRHKVTIQPFLMGKFEVRVDEYKACVAAKSCRPPEWLEPDSPHNIETGSGVTYKSMADWIKDADQPIVGISWDDANAYAAWLSKVTGKRYRLPSEAEWEYATRGGTSTRFWWGNDPRRGDEVMACCRGCGSERDARGLYPVNSFAPNQFGLYNVHGNVWEWVADYYCDDYTSAPTNGSARSEQTCAKQLSPEGLRVFRGGSCFYESRQMRAAMRLRQYPSFRNQTVGFRISRDLDHDATPTQSPR